MILLDLGDHRFAPAPQWFGDAIVECRAAMIALRAIEAPPPAGLTHVSKTPADLCGGSKRQLVGRSPSLSGGQIVPRCAPAGLLTADQAGAKPRRRPSIKRMIAAAERSGKTVTSITTPDGVTLHFGKAEAPEASNPWLDDLKVTKQ